MIDSELSTALDKHLPIGFMPPRNNDYEGWRYRSRATKVRLIALAMTLGGYKETIAFNEQGSLQDFHPELGRNIYDNIRFDRSAHRYSRYGSLHRSQKLRQDVPELFAAAAKIVGDAGLFPAGSQVTITKGGQTLYPVAT